MRKHGAISGRSGRGTKRGRAREKASPAAASRKRGTKGSEVHKRPPQVVRQLKSSREELQSAHEDLETSNEELRSLNEKLATVNSQLQEKVEELEAAHNDIGNLLKSADIAAVFVDADLSIRRFTAGAERLFKLIDPDIGRPLTDITVRFKDAELKSDVALVLDSLAPSIKKVPSEDGRWYARRIAPYRTSDNCIDGVVITFSDVTVDHNIGEQLRASTERLEERVAEGAVELQQEVVQREQVEEEIRAAYDLTDGVLHTAAALIIVRDPAGRVMLFNRACETASGVDANDALGKAAFDWLTSESDVAAVHAAYSRLSNVDGSVRYENRWRHRDGSERIISWSLSGIYDDSGALRYTIAVGIDVTEERRAQALAYERQQDLLHIYRVHTASGLAAALAHELNQPLAAAVAYSETSLARLRDLSVGSEIVGPLESAVAQTHRAAEIMRELRAFILKDTGLKVAIDVPELLATVRDLVAPQAQAAGVDVQVSTAPKLPQVMAGRIHLEQLLLNVVKNAVEAIRGAGINDGRVTINAHAGENADVLVTVVDNGPGMPPETMPRVFEPFFTTKSEGLGMGLAISRSIAEAHGGRLWADSAECGGTTINVTIPTEP